MLLTYDCLPVSPIHVSLWSWSHGLYDPASSPHSALTFRVQSHLRHWKDTSWLWSEASHIFKRNSWGWRDGSKTKRAYCSWVGEARRLLCSTGLTTTYSCSSKKTWSLSKSVVITPHQRNLSLHQTETTIEPQPDTMQRTVGLWRLQPQGIPL